MAYVSSELPSKYFTVYVECVACGYTHLPTDRSVAFVAVVDQYETVVLKRKVKQTKPVLSYLTPLTGLTAGDLTGAPPLKDVVKEVQAFLGKDTIIVGQNVVRNINWLGLEKGVDYHSTVDLVDMFKTYNPRFGNMSSFTLQHEANTLLKSGMIGDEHNPITAAIATIKLFNKYYDSPEELEEAKHELVTTKRPRSFVKENDYKWEGVCLAEFKLDKCTCEASKLTTMAYTSSELPSNYFSIDVECVACGPTHLPTDFSVALVAVVDQYETVLLKRKVKQTRPVLSYLTPLTGLTAGDLTGAPPLEDVVKEVKALLGKNAVIVGQRVDTDMNWLGLKKGVDYHSTVDLANMFKTHNPRFGNMSYFSLRHEANTLLESDMIEDEHDPATDAIASIRLFNKYYTNPKELEKAKQKLMRTRPAPSFPKQCDYKWEGVCLAGFMPEKCTCGAPTYKND